MHYECNFPVQLKGCSSSLIRRNLVNVYFFQSVYAGVKVETANVPANLHWAIWWLLLLIMKNPYALLYNKNKTKKNYKIYMKEMNVKCLRHIKLSQFSDKIIIVLTKRAFIILHWFWLFSFIYLGFSYLLFGKRLSMGWQEQIAYSAIIHFSPRGTMQQNKNKKNAATEGN